MVFFKIIGNSLGLILIVIWWPQELFALIVGLLRLGILDINSTYRISNFLLNMVKFHKYPVMVSVPFRLFLPLGFPFFLSHVSWPYFVSTT